MSANEIQDKTGNRANNMSSADIFKIVLETANLDDEALGKYCREHGLFAADIAIWKQRCLNVNSAEASNPERAAKELAKAF